MSIVAMKKLQLIAVRSQQEDILRELMLLGCVEISEPSEERSEELLGHLHRNDHGQANKRKAEQQTITNALRQLNRYSPYSKGLLTPLPEVGLEKLLDESALQEDLSIAEKILSLDTKVRSIAAQESRERSTLEAMKPWLEMELPLECKGTRTCDLLLGTVPLITPLTAVAEALGEAEAEVTQISEDTVSRYIAAVFIRGEQEKVLTALRGCGFAQVSMTGLQGTPRENTARLEKKLAELAAEKQAASEEIAAMAVHREALQLGADTLSTLIARAENGEKLLNTDSAFYFEGWVTAPDVEKLEKTLEKYSCAWELSEPDPEHPEEVPIQLKNNRFTAPYSMVSGMYSMPAYNGLDPNPFIAPFFALFFGIMFADMAYGILLLAAGLLFTYRAKPRGTMKNMAGLLIECGISTIVIGFLTGGFFGDVVTQIGKWFGQSWSIVPHLGTIPIGEGIDLPLDLLSGNNPLYVLILAICLGGVHLLTGVCLGMYLKIRDGQWLDAILNDFCWWVILGGLGVMVLSGSKVVLFIGIGMMVLGSLLTNKGFGKITGIFSAVYNGATGYLGDFLSYSRLMALMLAGSVIASVFNQLASLGNANGMTVVGTILFVVVFCIGHALNFGLNLIGCFVHTLRLQFLEFFGKWYRDGGRAFRPLQVSTRYVDVVKEERS